MATKNSPLHSMRPVHVFTAKDERDPDDYGQRFAVMSGERGFDLRVVKKSGFISAGQAEFKSPEDAERWARNYYMCAGRLEV
jgi:hypothetical protein